jgi:DNA-binding response OmpR family regulator
VSRVGIPPQAATPASILVVDDDRRVVELLTIALTAYGFRVLQAADGEEAMRVVTRERPDLVVLDVRLPKRSGFEVCELLRRDPDDPNIPIIMVSAAAETEARLQGLSRGADDYVAKPFSPKELIARIKRLLARSTESREAQRRGREAEHELSQARDEAKRSHAELRGEQRLRERTQAFVQAFHGLLDPDRLAERLLLEAQLHLGSSLTALLAPEGEDGGFRTVAVRGDAFERASRLTVTRGGALEPLLSGLGRPARHRELQRFPDLQPELAPFVAAGIAVFAPLCGPDGLVAVLVADERLDGLDIGRGDLEVVSILCDTAALALRNARRAAVQAEATLDALDAIADRDAPESAGLRAETARIVAAGAEGVPPGLRDAVSRAVRIANGSNGDAPARILAAAAAADPSGRVARLARMIERARSAEPVWEVDLDPDAATAAALVATGLAYLEARLRDLPPAAALERAIEAAGATLGDRERGALRERASRTEGSSAASASRSR